MSVISGIDRITAERQRQIESEGYTYEHDDAEKPGALTAAAVCYASMAGSGPQLRNAIREQSTVLGLAPRGWPWNDKDWKPGNDDSNQSRITELVKAGALIAAEIDRLQRQTLVRH
jgi:hypothetical protein